MNQPNDPRFDKLEQRVEKIEQVFDDIVESEKMIIKLSKRQNFNMQELSGKVGNLGLDIGDMRERFDTIERTMATKEDLAALKTTLFEILDRLPPKQ